MSQLKSFDLTEKLRITFKADDLSNSVIVACDKTGIVSTMNLPALPIVFIYQHPLADIGNCHNLISAIQKQNKKLSQALDRQVLSGIVLSYLDGLSLTFPAEQLSAAEKNLILQSCGIKLLDVTARFLDALSRSIYIEDHLKSKQRFPRFSFNWATKATAQSFAASFLSYVKTLQRQTDPTAIESERIGNISMDLVRAKEQPFSEQKRLATVRNVKTERRRFKELKDNAKVLFKDVDTFLPSSLSRLCRMVIRNMHLGLAEEHASLVASKLQVLQNDDCNRLAVTIKQCVAKHIVQEFGSFSDEVSPKPKKSIAEILAAKKAKAEGVIVDFLPQEEQDDSEDETNDLIDEVFDEEETLIDFVERVNNDSREEL